MAPSNYNEAPVDGKQELKHPNCKHNDLGVQKELGGSEESTIWSGDTKQTTCEAQRVVLLFS